MSNFLLRMMCRVTIRTRVLVGAGLMLLLLAIVSVTALLNLHRTKTDVVTVVSERQPLAITSLKLADTLDRANAALGFYLTSTEETDKQVYLSALNDLDEVLP